MSPPAVDLDRLTETIAPEVDSPIADSIRQKRLPPPAMTEVLASPSAQPYTARLAGAGALLDELEAVLHAAPVEASRDDFRRLILDENAARKSTANARMWAWKRLKLRYLLDSPDLPEFKAFRISSRDRTDRGRPAASLPR